LVCRLHAIWMVLLTVTLFPLKVFDLLLIHHPESHRCAATLMAIARKQGALPLMNHGSASGATDG
jgi:hypothetical protein